MILSSRKFGWRIGRGCITLLRSGNVSKLNIFVMR